MKKQALVIPALASLLFLSVACGKDSKKSSSADPEAPIEEPGQPVAPAPEPVQPQPPVTPAVQGPMKMVGLRFGSEYLTVQNEKIYNADAQGKIQSEVVEVKQSTTDASVLQETPVAARPRRIDSLNEEFFLLLQPEYNTCQLGPCEYYPSAIRAQSNYLVNKKNGDAWEIDSTFMPIPGTVKLVENDKQKTVFFLAHDARDRRFWNYYVYSKHYSSGLQSQLFVYGRKVLVAIDISRPDQKVLQPISGNLNVENYEVDRNGNAVVHSMDVEFKNSTYLIARNGIQPVISLVQDPNFKLKVSSSYIFRDASGDLYRIASPEYSNTRISKLEIGLEEGRAIARVVKDISVRTNNSYGADVATVREDADTIYVAISGDLLVLKKDFSAAKAYAFSTNNYLPDLYLEIDSTQKKAYVAGRNNQVMVATQIDLATDLVKPISVDSIEGKLSNFVQKDGVVQLTTLDEATDTTLVYGFEATEEKFKLKDRKPGQVDDSLRILVKVSGPLAN